MEAYTMHKQRPTRTMPTKDRGIALEPLNCGLIHAAPAASPHPATVAG